MGYSDGGESGRRRSRRWLLRSSGAALAVGAGTSVGSAGSVYDCGGDDQVYWLAKVIASEMGNLEWFTDAERQAVANTVVNRVEHPSYPSDVERIARRSYASSSEPLIAHCNLAQAVYYGERGDLTNGATHFYSPSGMPTDDENYEHGDLVEYTPGLAHDFWEGRRGDYTYMPYWAREYRRTFVNHPDHRPKFCKFFDPTEDPRRSDSAGGVSKGDAVTVATGGVDVRVKPRTWAKVKDTYEAGATGTVVGHWSFAHSGVDFVKVVFDDATGHSLLGGWVPVSSLVTGAGSSPRFETGQTVETTADLIVRDGPGLDAATIRSVPEGARATVINDAVNRDGYTWYGLDYSTEGIRGWSVGEHLALADGGSGGGSDPGDPPADEYVPADPSNYGDASRGPSVIDWIVMHHTAGPKSSAVSWFQNPNSNVSAHFVIGADGTVTQMVDLEDVAWHARYINDLAIGIEHEHDGDGDGESSDNIEFTDQLYDASAEIVAYLSEALDVPIQESTSFCRDDGGLIRHHDAPLDGACSDTLSTNCPGGLDVGRIVDLAREKKGSGGGGGEEERPRISLPGRIQAEDYHRARDADSENRGGAYRDDSVDIEESSTGGYNVGWIKRGEFLEYEVDVDAAGSYDLTARVACPDGGSGRFRVDVDGETVAHVDVPATGGWQSWQTVSVPAELPAGEHNVRVVMLEDDWNLDWIEFTDPVTNRYPLPGRIQAEDYHDARDADGENRGGAYRDGAVDVEPCSEGGYNVGWIEPGEFLEYEVDVDATDTYDFEARVASPSQYVGHFYVEVDDETVASVIVPDTGGWQSWQTVSVPVELPGGAHTMRLVADEARWNLNWIEVSPVDQDDPASETARTETGTLSGPGDEAIYQHSVGPSTKEVVIELEGESGTDFDLFVTADGRTPTRTDTDYWSWTSQSDEQIVIQGDELDGVSTLGIAVSGYVGSGNYTLTVENNDSITTSDGDGLSWGQWINDAF